MPERREHEPWIQYTAGRLRRRARWARTEGLARLVEEGELNPFDLAGRSLASWRWRLAHRSRPPGGRAVFLVGVQRSGTNMLVRGLERAPEFEVHNEDDRAAFQRFQLRPDPVIRRLAAESRHPYVLFKPLCDSHRTADLLDGLGTRPAPLALWAYRSVDGRARSAVAKFGDANLRVLRDLAAGGARDRWETQRLSPESLDLVASLDWATMTPASAAALFWYLRNRLFFDLGLAERPDVLLVSYDAMVARPEAEMRRLCAFLDFPYDGRLVAGMAQRAPAGLPPLAVDPRVRARCDELAARLEAARTGAAVP